MTDDFDPPDDFNDEDAPPAEGLYQVYEDNLILNFHPGQARAWEAKERFLFVLAGSQAGKTSFEPLWLDREIADTCSPLGGNNDYIAATATFGLLKLKFLPELLNYFEHVRGIGRYWSGDQVIELKDPSTDKFWANRAADRMWGRIILRSAASGGGLESASVRGALLDEAGLPDYTIGTWEAVLRRLSLSQGRVLAATTLYDMGWIYSQVYQRVQRIGTKFEQPGDTDFAIINFDSTENPAFSVEEFERAKASMPEWRFNMFYRGLYTRPAGQIYDCFIDKDISEGGHRMQPFTVPAHWHRVAGADFGVVNTCFGLYALQEDEEGYPTGKAILTRTYHQGGDDTAGHIANIRKIEPNLLFATGGAASEDAWRNAYRWAGLPIYAPGIPETGALSTVEVGIDAVYSATKHNNLLVFDTETVFRDQKTQYSRELDELGNPTETIKDKAKYHRLDQERYLSLLLFPKRLYLPFVPRKHLIIRSEEERMTNPVTQSIWWRFGGLFYREGLPAAFLLCASDQNGNVIVEAELHGAGMLGSQFAKKITELFETLKIDKQTCYIAANEDLFNPRPSATAGTPGAAPAEVFWAEGLAITKADGDGVREWRALKERMATEKDKDGVLRDGLQVDRKTCPVLSLTLGMVAPDGKNPESPDGRGPIELAQALCFALLLRPTATVIPDNKPKIWKPSVSDDNNAGVSYGLR